MTSFILYPLAFLVLLGVLVVIHEFGHFAVARLCGVKVLRFSVGFGRVLWKRRLGKDQTELTLCAIPLGGYVRMVDEREVDEGERIAPEDLPRAFNRQGVGARSAIVAAGPMANFLLAVLIYWLMFMVGSDALLPVLGTPDAETPAAAAGIANGDRVLAVDGEVVATLEDFHLRLMRQASLYKRVELEVVDRQQVTHTRVLDTRQLDEKAWEGNPLDILGLRLYQLPVAPVVGEVMPDLPGAKAGLRSGDRVLSVDGIAVQSWGAFVDVVRRSPEKTLRVVITRAGQEIPVSLTPEKNGRIGRIGAGVSADEMEKVKAAFDELHAVVRYGPIDAAKKATIATIVQTALTVRMMGKMFTGKFSWRNLSGPITIADYAGKTAKIGLDAYLKFMAIVSLCLGIFNLLPIPVLDGGHLLYHALELIKGSPVSEKAMEVGQKIGLSLLATLMVFAFFNDFSRLLTPLFNG
ncbi:MAG: RIP metalloprotease RseP [Zoogloeaceae bacterium]|jgi:regulator of sigma E protease|nr:RIP metalloprotease RseP [Zoogloeaceae bacterium]